MVLLSLRGSALAVVGLLAAGLLSVGANPAAAQNAPEPAAAQQQEQSVAALVARISRSVESIRGERFKRPVRLRQLSPAEMRRHLQSLIEQEWPAQKMAAQQELFRLLGLLPPDTDLRTTLTDVLGEQVGGLYDPAAGVMLVGQGMGGQLLEIVLAHELTHALDDQLYDLRQLQELARETTDLSFALSAVVEGSGTLVMNRYLLEVAGTDPERLPELLAESGQAEAARGEKLMAAPPFVQRNLLLSYLLGQTFLVDSPVGALSLLSDPSVSPEKFARAFLEPPLSSEQILHPERFWDPARRDLPSRLVLPDVSQVLGAGWQALESDTFGELNAAILTGSAQAAPEGGGWNAMLGLLTRSDWTTPAAAGWDGDTAILCGRGGQRAALWVSLWDSPSDAAEFYAAYAPPGGRPAGKAQAASRVAVVVGVEDATTKAGALLEKAQVLAESPLNRQR
jgi:hypothetical protein